MDNGAKALMMAGGVLIALLVISLTVYMVNVLRKYNEDSSALTATTQNESFNRFFVYLCPSGNKVRGYDAYNAIMKAIDMNVTLDPQDKITISVGGSSVSTGFLENLKNNDTWLESEHTYTYSYGPNGKIASINII